MLDKFNFISIIGNSGSGKSTLAKRIARALGPPILDLDTVVWEPNKLAVPRPLPAVVSDIDAFCMQRSTWVVEGCYADAIGATLRFRPLLVFMNPGVEVCLEHCKSRPWEPHKWASAEEQNTHLDYLLGWVADYYVRDGNMSFAAHRELFDAYPGPKDEFTDRLGHDVALFRE